MSIGKYSYVTAGCLQPALLPVYSIGELLHYSRHICSYAGHWLFVFFVSSALSAHVTEAWEPLCGHGRFSHRSHINHQLYIEISQD